MLDAADLVACQAALSRLRAAAESAKSSTSGVSWALKSLWSKTIGADSTAAAAESEAAAWERLATTMQQKLDGWMASPGYVSHLEALDFVATCDRNAGTSTLDETVNLLSPATAVATVAADTAKDAADAAKGVLGALPWLAAAVVAVVVLVLVARFKRKG